MEHRITEGVLENVVNRVVSFLEQPEVISGGLERYVGTRVEIGRIPPEFIEIKKQPGGRGLVPTSLPITLSYIIDGKGIPLELRINDQEHYSAVIVKVYARTLGGYTKLTEDPNGNSIYHKILVSEELTEVLSELRTLRGNLAIRSSRS